MKRILLILISMSLLSAGCRRSEPVAQEPPDTRPTIVCTTGMIADIAEQVAGDRYNVIGLMGPGVDPHLYQATMGDIRAIDGARIIFFNGLHLEAKMGDVLEEIGKTKPVVKVTDGLDPEGLLAHPDYEGQYDPHVWFDVTMWISAVETIRQTLVNEDPDHAEAYSLNASNYTAELEELHRYVLDQTSRIPDGQRVLVTAHDAFGYYGRRYNIEVRGLQGISTLAEAGVADVQNLVNFIVDRKIRAIFVESSVPRKKIQAVQEAAAQKGWKVSIGGELFSDAMGDAGTPEGTFIGMVRHNTDTIVAALLGE